MINGLCFCASGIDDRFGEPTLCCGDTGSCPTATTCLNIDGTMADLCVGTDLNLCLAAGEVPTREQAHACFTPPGETLAQAYWRRGDCDEDGTSNAMEVEAGRDPCCNEGTDLSCCLAVPDADPLACCNDTAAESASGCCLIHDGSPELCCEGADPVTCCADATDPLACCEAVATEDATCCAYDEDPAACCLDADGDPAVCCSLEGAEGQEACAEIDASVAQDAGERPDAGIATPDAGVNAMDGGPSDSDGGTSFGGGGGCVCTVGVGAEGDRAPSPAALLALALAITIPAFRRRRQA
jgi:hypothetical protein